MSDMLSRKDLTRWNRAGLTRFRYIDGNAITYLEALRLAMRDAFTDEDGVNKWIALDSAMPAPATESASERQARWIAQYRDQRRDYGWEILRAFARSSHILGEYLHAYANESYLKTATQWDNVRRLVEMLDYHPAPPASAETTVAFLTKADKAGTLETGFAFKNKPKDGSKPVVFETLVDLEVDYRLNQIRPADWDQSQKLFIYADGSNSAGFPLAEPLQGVAAGGLGVLLIERPMSGPVGLAVTVTSVTDDLIQVAGETKPIDPEEIRRHQVRLLLNPRFRQVPRMTGTNVIATVDAHGLTDESFVAWMVGSSWNIARVEATLNNRLLLSQTAPAAGTDIYQAIYAEEIQEADGWSAPRLIFPAHSNGARIYGALWDENLDALGHSHGNDPDSGETLYDYVSGDDYTRVYFVPDADPIAAVQESSQQGLELDGNPGSMATGDWLVVDNGGYKLAAEIDTVVVNEDSYTLELSKGLTEASMLYGNFELDISPSDHDRNDEPIFLTDLSWRSDTHSWLPIALSDTLDLLSLGRKLIVAGDNEAMVVTVKDVDTLAGALKVEPAIPGSELTGSGTNEAFTRYLTTIYGNVALSGHGETKGEKILGTGDATRTGQEFAFGVEEVSHVVDATFPQGVRAAVDVTVDNRSWQQVPTLNDSDPEDPHYVVRMQEDGTLRIDFGGDGRGRRLPTGNNNVRIVHRVGTGLAGNLNPLSLEKELKPHHLIDKVLQPLAASGGNDLESADSMRDNAPASVLTLTRAVSLSDFAHLATANSGVWQARAFRRPPGMGRADKIDVVVVPAGGGALGSLENTLTDYLESHALPGVQVTVVPYRSLVLDVALELRIKKDEYDSDFVVQATRTALTDAFALNYASLGEPFYRSQVFAAVEAVEGVENCGCQVNLYGFRDADGAVVLPQDVAYGVGGEVRRISPDDDQVVFLHEDESIVEITVQEFSL